MISFTIVLFLGIMAFIEGWLVSTLLGKFMDWWTGSEQELREFDEDVKKFRQEGVAIHAEMHEYAKKLRNGELKIAPGSSKKERNSEHHFQPMVLNTLPAPNPSVFRGPGHKFDDPKTNSEAEHGAPSFG